MTILVADERFAAPDQFEASDGNFAMGLRTVRLASGGFVAVWERSGHLVGQMFDAHGAPAGGIFQLESNGAPVPGNAMLAPLPGGGFVATWHNFIAAGFDSQWRVEYRLFDAAGQSLGPQQPVSAAYGQYPSIAALEGGGFVIAFTAPDGGGVGIHAQRFDSQGTKVGAEFLVNSTTAGEQFLSRSAALPGGGFLVAWLDSTAIRGQIFDSSGQKVGGELDIVTSGAAAPNLAVLPSGNIVVTYVAGEIKAKILTPAGAVAVPEFQVNSSTAGTQSFASVAVLPTDEFLITWYDFPELNAPDPDAYIKHGEVRGQLFAADGSRIGDEFLVNNVTERGQTEPVSTAFGSGDVATLWIDYQHGQRWEAVVSVRLFFSPTFGTEGADSFAGTPERDFYYALGGDDSVAGAERADGLDGGEGNDSLDGGAGNDVLIAGAGTDVLAGGDGNDTLYFGAEYAPDDIASGGAGRDAFVLQGNYGATLGAGLSGIESISLQSGAITRYGDTADNFYDYAIATIDSLVGAGQQMIVNAQSLRFGEEFVFDGSAETDGSFFVHGGQGNDLLRGGAGSDTLLSGAGTDRLIGGDGNDTLYFGRHLSGGDSADGGAGRDTLVLQGNYVAGLASVALAGIESISLQSGSRTTWGDTANNFYDYDLTMADSNVAAGMQLIVNGQSLRVGEDFAFDGSAETDGRFLVFAGHGVDTLEGGSGDDIFFFEGSRFGASDTIDGGAGRDSVVISAGSGLNRYAFGASSFTGIESISVSNRYATDPSQKPSYEFILHNGNVASGGNLIVNGSSLAADQTINVDGRSVSGGNLFLVGGEGSDTLSGGAGGDRLLGGRGADGLSGGNGADIFRYDATSDSTSSAPDLIGDFQGGTDKVDLSRIDANASVAGDQAFTWIGSNAFSGTAGELRTYESGGYRWIAGDTDGDGSADLVIAFQTGTAPLQPGDFLL